MADDESTNKRLGDFEIIRELGRGGMGIVYEARQISLNRKVALKVISSRLGLSSKAILRFQREAEAAGKLHHTNIVPIYTTGQGDGAHYYAMELIDGPSLHQVIRSLRRGETNSPKVSGSTATVAVASVPPAQTNDSVVESSGAVETPAWVSEILGSLSVSAASTPAARSSARVSSTNAPRSSDYFDTVATMIAGVAEALDYAHENGVIHRDIKPANLLLSKDGRVSINDFGLARMLEQPGMTMSGEFVGSPLYMSPEQITAGRAPLDHRTDIYSLGATLYELLTLQPLFPGQTRDEVIAQILHKEPTSPRRHNPKLPVDLETICLKAMEKDPDRRYQTAGQLAEDLRRFVNRHAISARRIGPLERAVRWARKNKALTAMACFALLVGIVSAGFVYHGWRKEQERLHDQAKQDALLAAYSGDPEAAQVAIERAENLGVSRQWILLLKGQVAWFGGRPQELLASLEQALKEDPDSIVARSMMAEAYVATGRWSAAMNALNDLQVPTAGTDDYTSEELLCQSMAFRELAPERALEVIERVLEKSPNYTFAQILARVQRAIKILASIETLHPNLDRQPLLRVEQLVSQLTAFNLNRLENRPAKANEHLQIAGRYVQYLEDHPGYFYGISSRLHYYRLKWEVEKDEAHLDEMERILETASGHAHIGFGVVSYWTTFYRSGKERIAKALHRLSPELAEIDLHVAWGRIVLLMEVGAREEAEKICLALWERHRSDSGYMHIFPRLFLYGPSEEMIDYAKKRAEAIKGSSTYWTIPYDVLSYLGGLITEAELIDRAGRNHREQAIAHFVIGLYQLTKDNRRETREAAKDNFKKSFETGYLFWPETMWSQAFFDRLEKDENWPDWLQATPSGSEAK